MERVAEPETQPTAGGGGRAGDRDGVPGGGGGDIARGDARGGGDPRAVAGSDAERRAALGYARQLSDGGRVVTVQTVWLRPRGELTYALHAALGVLASLLAVGTPVIGLALAAAALLSLLLDLGGRAFLLRRLTPERATQNVVAEAPARVGAAAERARADRTPTEGAPTDGAPAAPAPPLRVLLTAHADVRRGGVLRRLARSRLARGSGRVPGPMAWVALALLAVAACAGARLAGAEGSALGAIQLVPTLVLVISLGLLVDAALSRPSPAAATAPGVVVAAAQALDAAPPRNLAVEVVIAGAGASEALGFRAYLRARRPAPERNVVIEVAAGEAATAPTWWTSDGALLPLRYHPQLVALAGAAAADEPGLGARGRRGRTVGAALRARQRRIPAIRLAAPEPADALALTLALIELLDESRD